MVAPRPASGKFFPKVCNLLDSAVLHELINLQRSSISATCRMRLQLLRKICVAWLATLTTCVKHTRRTKCSRMSSESCKRTCNDSTQTHPMFTAITRSNWPSKALLRLAVQSLSLLSVMALTRDRHHHHQDTATDSRQQARCKVLSMATDAEHLRFRRRDSATRPSSLRWPRDGSSSQTFHGSFPARINLLVDLTQSPVLSPTYGTGLL